MKIRTLGPKVTEQKTTLFKSKNSFRVALLLPFIAVGVLGLGVGLGTLQHQRKMIEEGHAHYNPKTGEYTGGRYEESIQVTEDQLCKNAGKFEAKCREVVRSAR